MNARNSGRFVRTLQQLAQSFTSRRVSNEIDEQIDSFIRKNNSLISEFQARARALDATKVEHCTFFHLHNYKRLVEDCSQLNYKLDVLRNQLKSQSFDQSFQMIKSELWPLVWEIARHHAEETGLTGSLIDDLFSLGVVVERYVDISTANGGASLHSHSCRIDRIQHTSFRRNKMQIARIKMNYAMYGAVCAVLGIYMSQVQHSPVQSENSVQHSNQQQLQQVQRQ